MRGFSHTYDGAVHISSTPLPHTRSPRVLPAALCVLFLVLGLLAVPTTARASTPAPATSEPAPLYETPDLSDGAPAPEPVAEAWAAANLDTGEIFAERNPDEGLAPASVIKLLTALALVDVLDDPARKYEAQASDMQVDGTKVGLMYENSYTIDDLFHAMLMSSANDAAHALGEAAGGQEKAVRLMNDKAAELGLTGTVAKNTSGLDATGQVLTVRDLLVIADAVLDDEYLMSVISTEHYTFPGATNPDTKEKTKSYDIQNHTQIVGEVPGGKGLKNGYTKHARGSFVAVIERDGTTYASAILKAENSTRQSAIDLIDWGAAQSALPTVEPIVAPTPTPTAEPDTAAAPTVVASGKEDAEDGSNLLVRLGFPLAFVLIGGGAVWAVLFLGKRRKARH